MNFIAVEGLGFKKIALTKSEECMNYLKDNESSYITSTHLACEHNLFEG
jgi:hypothetical protein